MTADDKIRDGGKAVTKRDPRTKDNVGRVVAISCCLVGRVLHDWWAFCLKSKISFRRNSQPRELG